MPRMKTENFGGGNFSWIGAGAHGIADGRTEILDISTFTAGTHYPNGYIPSGIVLGKVTATGKYGPYDDAANDGRAVAAGFLFAVVKPGASTSTPIAAALLQHGVVVEAKLPTNNGIDAAAKTDLAGRIIVR